ncbi:ATP-binding cassette domain-containing protein [Candidatus Methanoperedens nitratireducens]|uniref:ABC transporter, ATP-binding protein n=1 Tax=Candidatus Methanoperedens nitratireducens TaxID=1392998 RepID=A0A284VQC4_9EURY
MAEVEEICDRIGVIARGKLLAVGTVEELRNKVREKEGARYVLEVQDLPVQRVIEGLKGVKGVRSVEPVNGHISLLTDPDARLGIAAAVKSMGGTISMFEEERMDLQRVFLKLIEASA